MGDGVAQAVFVHVMLDDALAAPARDAARKVGLAVAVAIEFRGNRRVLQVAQVLDARVIGLLVDEVALDHALDEGADALQHVVATGFLEEGLVQQFPVRGVEVRVAGADGQVRRLDFHLLRLDRVAQRLKALVDDAGLEQLFRDGACDRADGHAFAGLVLREGRHR